jgi:hypothetical protein
MLGYPESWTTWSAERTNEYMDVVRDGFEIGHNCMIVRGADRINYLEAPTSTTDIWWLVDDGGFTILMPWLLSQKKYWQGTKLRIFTVPGNLEIDQAAQMATNFEKLVAEFRIPASVHVEIPDPLTEAEYQTELDQMHSKFAPEALERTKRYIMLSKLMQEYSSEADVVFVTLPFPPDEVLAENWLQWLEILSPPPFPPTVFLRGNQQSLLSVYT